MMVEALVSDFFSIQRVVKWGIPVVSGGKMEIPKSAGRISCTTLH